MQILAGPAAEEPPYGGQCCEPSGETRICGTALDSMDRSASSRPLPLLAVLPFSTGYDVPEYLGLAIAEQVMDHLSRARPAVASIAARDSACTLERLGRGAQEIGKLLHAELVLTGQVLATPGRYRLRVETIRVEDGASLWVEDVIAERDQMVELAGELVNRVTSRLRAEEFPSKLQLEAVRPRNVTCATRGS